MYTRIYRENKGGTGRELAAWQVASATLSNQTAQHKSAIYTTLNHGRGDFKQQKMYISSEALEEFGEPIQL